MNGYIPEQQPEPIQSISFERIDDKKLKITCNGFETTLIDYENLIIRQLTNSNPRIVVKSSDEKVKYVFPVSSLVVGGDPWPGTNVNDAIDYLTGNVFGIGTPSGKLDQEITFTSPAARAHGAPAFDLAGFSSSGLPLTYVSADPTKFTIAGKTVTPIAAGTANITASQAGDDIYNAAANVVVPFTLT